MKIKRVSFAVATIMGAMLIYQAVDVSRYPMPVGDNGVENSRIAVSPDSQYAAAAITFQDKTFWGTSTLFYEFRIMRLPNYDIVRTFKVVPPEGDLVYDYSESGSFKWALDSLGVEVGMFGAEMKIQALEH